MLVSSRQGIYHILVGKLEKRTDIDTQFHRHGIKPAVIESVQVTRLLADEFTKPGTDNSIEAVAQRTGHSIYHVRRLMQSEEFKEALARAQDEILMPGLAVYQQWLVSVLRDEEMAPSAKFKAGAELRAMREMWETMIPKQAAEEEGARLLNELAKLTQKTQIITATTPEIRDAVPDQ